MASLRFGTSSAPRFALFGRRSRRLLAIAALALATAGCFNPDKPVCSYACSDTSPKCPDDYECRSDGYCHRVGTPANASCGFSDAAMPGDMSAAVGGDMSPADLASSD